MNKVSAIILAAGSGSRFGEKKQFKELNGKPIWVHSLNTFVRSACVDDLILVIPNDSLETLKQSQVFISLNKKSNIKISAQSYLVKFYNSLGFYQIGEEYLEDGIPHIKMLKN